MIRSSASCLLMLAAPLSAAAQVPDWDSLIRMAEENVRMACNEASDAELCRMQREALETIRKARDAEQTGATAPEPPARPLGGSGAASPQRVSSNGVTFTHRGHWDMPGASGSRLYTVEIVNEGKAAMRCAVTASGLRYNVGTFTGARSVQSEFSDRTTVHVFPGRSGQAQWNAVVPGTARYSLECAPA